MSYGIRSSRVYKSLSAPKLIAGAEKSFFMLNAGLALFAMLGAKIIWWPVITWVIHRILVQLAKKDPDARKIYMQYSKQADRYDPWIHISQKRGFRPLGFGKGSPS